MDIYCNRIAAESETTWTCFVHMVNMSDHFCLSGHYMYMFVCISVCGDFCVYSGKLHT